MLNNCLFIKIAISLDVIFPLLMVSGKYSCTEGSMAWKFMTVSTVQLPADQLLGLLGGDGDMSLAPRGLAQQGLGSLPLKNVARGVWAAHVQWHWQQVAWGLSSLFTLAEVPTSASCTAWRSCWWDRGRFSSEQWGELNPWVWQPSRGEPHSASLLL